MDDRALRIAEDLYLDVTGAFDVTFDVNVTVLKRGLSLGRCLLSFAVDGMTFTHARYV